MLQKVEHAAIYLVFLVGNPDFLSKTNWSQVEITGIYCQSKLKPAFGKKRVRGITRRNLRRAVPDKKRGRSQGRPPREKLFVVTALFFSFFRCPFRVDHVLENSPRRFVWPRIISWRRHGIFGMVERDLILDYARQIVIFF